MRSKKRFNVRTVVKAGFLVAISVVMTRFVYMMLPIGGSGSLRLSFGELPIMLSGFLFGPIMGGLTGIAADFIGILVNSQGAFHPGFTISSMMWGIIPGVVMLLFKKDRTYSLKKVVLAVGICYIMISLCLNTFWLNQLYGTAFLILLPPRIVSAVVSVPVMSIIARALLKYLRQFASF